ncbi:DUF2637 domain-containing protein [Kitasatospora sp. NPDC049285]|uniref:DUF2637 domain-containing protein n=1 Tax=Kitasatospora sp. NPDC049285 TaxID=3157096 RepID=UPI0034202656
MARPSLTRAHRALLGVVAVGACIISGIGFAGSYNSVRDLAMEKGFGAFSYAFPIGVDAGIVVLLSLDLVLTWLRIPFPLLRQTAWLLTAATIAFNAAASWGDALGMAMHAVIPVLFVVVVEASRHAVGRIAAITADRHMESVRLMRWVLSPVPTFRLWRRMKLWELRSYDETVRLEQNRLVYRAQLRFRYGRGWRRSAPFQALLPLKLAKYGVPLDPSILDRIDGPMFVAADAAVAGAAIAPAGPGQVTAGQSVAGPAAAHQVAAHQAVGQQAAGHPVAGQAPAGQAPAGQAVAGHPAGAAEAGEPHAVPSVSAAVAVPTLAKLAAVRRRDQQDPEAAQAAPPVDAAGDLNVWTARPVRSHVAEPDQVHTARVPGQASPWFKPPRGQADADQEAAYAAPQAAGYPDERGYQERYPQQGRPVERVAAGPAANGRGPARPQPGYGAGPNGQPGGAPRGRQLPVEQALMPEDGEPIRIGARPVRLDSFADPEPLPFEDVEEAPARLPFAGGAEPLDPDECFDALVSYMEENQRQPDERRFAEYLSQRGVPGSRPDGGVTVKDVERIWAALGERYMESGRAE